VKGLLLCHAIWELDSASYAHCMSTHAEHFSKCRTMIDSAVIILVFS